MADGFITNSDFDIVIDGTIRMPFFAPLVGPRLHRAAM